jgi:hypothetical protein
VTYVDAASVWRAIGRCATPALVVLLGFGVAGCETGSSLFGGSLASNETPPAEQAPAAASPIAKVALAPVIGAPEQVSKQLVSQLTSAVEKQRISVAPDRDAKADYMLRGYIVAARDKSQTKVSYIWDVTDPSGKRVNRITGEEVLATVNPKDPWASVTPTVTQNIAEKTASTLGSWVPSQGAALASNGSTSAAAPAAVGAPRNQSQVQSASGSSEGAPTPRERTSTAAASSAAAVSSTTTTASLPRNDEVGALAPTVTGAPGDGNSALASALQSELTRQGIAITNRPASYKVEGKVTLGAAKDGKQAITIDWRVKDPSGKSLGTVSQKNEIPQGSLDGAWGKTADAAASAAAQGIIKLLPQPKSTN